jgi:DNA-binding NtrC family response regulator
MEPEVDSMSSSASELGHLQEFTRFVRSASAVGTTSDGPRTLRAWVDLAEAYRITQTLKECRGNRSAAARRLGIGRRTLYAKMEKLGISATWRVE